MSTHPDQRPIPPTSAFDVRLRVPGSKSLTNRALLLAALANGRSQLHGALLSDDTRRMIEALQALGFHIDIDHDAHRLTVDGQAGRIPNNTAELHLGNAGTAIRSLTAACCLGKGPYRLDGVPRMRHRPIGELVDPLRQIGAQIAYLGQIGYPPLEVMGSEHGLQGGTIEMAPTLSSQFISALLMIAPFSKNGLSVQFHGPVTSQPYVEMTLGLMRRFGAVVGVDEAFTRLSIEPGSYNAGRYDIEPDASNASYFLAAASVVPGSRCIIDGLGLASLQGDVQFAHLLSQMGAKVELTEDSVTVTAPEGPLRGIDVDLNRMPDMAQTLAAVAVFAEGPTTIRNVGNLRVKETDRLAALQTELTKLGVTALIHGDDLRIEPPADGQLKAAAIDTYDDHRMAMSFAVIGLRTPGITINNPACVNKTFPDFFSYLQRLTPKPGVAG